MIDLANIKETDKEIAEFYIKLIENTNDIVSLLDNNLKILYIKENQQHITAFNREELIGKNARDFLHPEDFLTCLKAFRTILKKGEGTTEYRFRCKDGSYKWVESNIKVIERNKKSFKLLFLSREIPELNVSENKRLKYDKKIEILNKIIIATSKTKNFLEMLNQALDLTLKLMNFDGGGIYLINESKQIAEIICHKNLPLDFVEDANNISITKNPYNMIFCDGHPIFSEDYLKLNPTRSLKWGFLSVASVPIWSQDKVIGALNIVSKTRYFFSEEEKVNLKAICYEIGNAIERNHAKKLVLKSEEKIKSMFDSIQDFILVVDTNGRILQTNPAVSNKLHYSKEELSNLYLANLYPANYNEDDFSLFNEILQKDLDSCSIPLKTKEGVLIPVETIAMKGKWGDQDVILGISRDISERVHSKLKLKESEEKYRVLFNGSPCGIILVDLKGRIVESNKTVETTFGYKKEEILGKIFLDYAKMSPEQITLFKERLKNFKEGRTPEPINLNLADKKGNIVWINLRSSLIELDNEKFIISMIQDISNVKKAELKIKESEEKYRALVELLPDIIYEADLNLNLTYINKIAFEKFGYTQKDFEKGISVLQIITPEYRDLALNNIKILLEGKNPKPTEYLVKRKDDSHFYVRIHSRPIKKDERIIGITGTITDINDKVLSDQKLKDSEIRYRELFNNMSSCVAVYEATNDGTDFKFKDFNRAAEKLEKINKEQIINKKVSDVFPGVKDFGLFDVFQNVWKTGIPKLCPVTCYKDKRDPGSWRENFVYKLPSGEIVAVYNDETEKKVAEEKLKESEQKYRELIETSSMGLLEIDMVNKKVSLINPKLIEILGYSKDELSNPNIFYTIVHPEDVKELIRSRETKIIEFRIIDKNGNIKWLYGNRLFYYNLNGDLTSLRLWLADITEKKKADEIINNEIMKLKELDIIKTEFVYRASHELKTPLNLICSSSELLNKYYSNLLDDRATSLVRIINEGGTRLKNLVDQLLDVSRIESGKIKLIKQKENVVDILTDCVNSVLYLVKERKLNLFFNFKENFLLDADKIRIEQVFINILTNAIKNTPPNGNIFIKLMKVLDELDIQIQDTGIGLTKDEKELLFKKFGKIERYGKGLEIDTEGSGLGLYISKEIVESHGGRIFVESEGRNKGSTFTIRLPIR